MPYSCTKPYDRTRASIKDRVKSCSSASYGPYGSKQPCIEECYVGGKGQLNAAASVLQRSFAKKRFRTRLSKRLSDARVRLSGRKTSGRKTKSPPSKCVKQPKTVCSAMPDCRYTSDKASRSYCYSAKRPRRKASGGGKASGSGGGLGGSFKQGYYR